MSKGELLCLLYLMWVPEIVIFTLWMLTVKVFIE